MTTLKRLFTIVQSDDQKLNQLPLQKLLSNIFAYIILATCICFKLRHIGTTQGLGINTWTGNAVKLMGNDWWSSACTVFRGCWSDQIRSDFVIKDHCNEARGECRVLCYRSRKSSRPDFLVSTLVSYWLFNFNPFISSCSKDDKSLRKKSLSVKSKYTNFTV